MAMKIYRQVTRTYMKTFVQKNSPFMDFEIWPKFSLEPLHTMNALILRSAMLLEHTNLNAKTG